MANVVSVPLAGCTTSLRSQGTVQLELLALRPLLAVYQRAVARPRIRHGDPSSASGGDPTGHAGARLRSWRGPRP